MNAVRDVLASQNKTIPVENGDPERGKAFAREQVQFLKDQGILDPERISRIFKVAGPGQIQESWRLATCTKDATMLDVLDCLLTGFGGSQDFGRERMQQVLEKCGFYVPQVHSDSCFFRALDGALEILVPGSCDLNEETERSKN